MNWKELPSGNEVLEEKDAEFFISYRGARNSTVMGILFFASDDGLAETALVVKEPDRNKYFILNGDWRKEYEERYPLGLALCLDFFKSKMNEHISSWSDRLSNVD